MHAVLALELRLTLEAIVATRGSARIALSGGTNPAPLYTALAARELPWATVTLALVDERWVGLDDPGSNERLIREAFAPAIAAGAKVEPMKTDDATPAAAAAAVEARYRALRPFDVVVLGMGLDGHTASWFPNAEGLAQALDPADGASVAAVRAVGSPVAGAYVDRMTLTRPAIAEAGRVLLLITGEDKHLAYERASELGPETEAPIRALLHRGDAKLSVCWSY